MSTTPLVAYLLLVHTDPAQAARLVGRLCGDDAVVLIHVDAKSDGRPFAKAIQARECVRFLPERTRVFYQGYTPVVATLRLMEAAIETGAKYHVLLSAADYPVKPASHRRGLFESTTQEYVGYWPLTEWSHWQYRVQQYHYLDSLLTNKVCGPRWTRTLYYYVRRYGNKLLPTRRFVGGLTPYGGPEWWMLTRDCAAWILATMSDRPEIGRFFRFTRSPAEMIIPTMVMNSPFRERVYGNHLGGMSPFFPADAVKPDYFSFRYVDWSQGGGSPKVLKEADLEHLRSTHCLFARKFAGPASAALLQRLDEEVLSE